MLLVTNFINSINNYLLNVIIEYHVVCTYTVLFLFLLLSFKYKIITKKTLLIPLLLLLTIICIYWTSLNLSIYSTYLILRKIYLLYFLMVAFKLQYFFVDMRQKKISFILKNYKNKFKKFSFYKDWEKLKLDQLTIVGWSFSKPLESMLLLKNYNNLKFYTTTVNNSNTLSIQINYNDYYKFLSTLKINTHTLYSPVDLTSYGTNNIIITNTITCYSSSIYMILHTNINTKIKYKSLSPFYQSFTWMERELKEFSSIQIINLRDTRRLLTDYTSNLTNNYNLISYNNLTQDLYYGNTKSYVTLVISIYLSFCYFNFKLNIFK